VIPARYPLVEKPSERYSQRTRWNIRDSDATQRLSWGVLTGGTRLTAEECSRIGKQYLMIGLAASDDHDEVVRAARNCIATNVAGGVLNVAGPRASRHPAVYERARAFLLAVLG
jgi:hypothetical protein